MRGIQIKKSERYHLIIVAACFMLMFASYGACYNCLSIFVVDMENIRKKSKLS